MVDLSIVLWIIPLAPLAAALTLALLGKTILRDRSHWPCIAALAVSFLAAAHLLYHGPESGDESGWLITSTGYEWAAIGDWKINIALSADALSAIMLVTVTLVSLLVAIYSASYMHGDPGYPRYFAAISLFVFSMTMLVLANNFLLLYVFWEAVGLCSYLLIGFWFNKPSAAVAARKAFLVNRIGDFGFAIGIFLIWTNFGYTLDYREVFTQAGDVSASVLIWICLLLFAGAVGKSAQFPLHVWLPDAMEGPSPVSALIHAATMVTAGVYMVARCMPLFVQAPAALIVVACVGGFTALLAALIALTQYDLKRILAYSTVSQLGYMFLALGSAAIDKHLAAFAVTAAIFHLFTHAFFKALLFLGAGSVMHSMGDIIDMRRFGGLRKLLPGTHWTFLIGCLALAGVIPFAGFWSKDEIISSLFSAGAEGSGSLAGLYYSLAGVALLTALLTAFYTFRAYFLTFWGEKLVPPEAGDHPHDAPPMMLWPLIILAVAAVSVGILGPTHVFGHYLAEAPDLHVEEDHALNYLVMLLSTICAAAGIGGAWLLYGKESIQPVAPPSDNGPWWQQLSYNKFYLDEVFNGLLVLPLQGIAVILKVLDQYLVDGLVDLFGRLPALFGQLFRPVQNGLIQFYGLAMLFGLVVFVVALILGG